MVLATANRQYISLIDYTLFWNATQKLYIIGKKNWVMIDTINGAEASAVIYSLTETAKANNLKPYEYIKHLLEVIPQHMDDTNTAFLEDLLPWSDRLPDECRKVINK